MGKRDYTEVERLFLAGEYWAGLVPRCPKCRGLVQIVSTALTERPLKLQLTCLHCDAVGEFVSPEPMPAVSLEQPEGEPAEAQPRCWRDRAWLLPPEKTGDSEGRWICPVCGFAVRKF